MQKMKFKYLYPFLAIFVVEYILRTFIKGYKYHEVGLFLEFMPIVLCTAFCVFFYQPVRKNKNGFKSYLLFNFVAISGYLLVNVFLYFQWYWIIAPKYRNFPGDMEEGLMWGILSFIIGTILIFIVSSFLITQIRNKLTNKNVEINKKR